MTNSVVQTWCYYLQGKEMFSFNEMQLVTIKVLVGKHNAFSLISGTLVLMKCIIQWICDPPVYYKTKMNR